MSFLQIVLYFGHNKSYLNQPMTVTVEGPGIPAL
jgi:hypothetical protein